MKRISILEEEKLTHDNLVPTINELCNQIKLRLPPHSVGAKVTRKAKKLEESTNELQEVLKGASVFNIQLILALLHRMKSELNNLGTKPPLLERMKFKIKKSKNESTHLKESMDSLIEEVKEAVKMLESYAEKISGEKIDVGTIDNRIDLKIDQNVHSRKK